MKTVIIASLVLLIPLTVLSGPFWIVKWYDVNEPGSFGRYIFTEIFPNFEFSKDWGDGTIFYIPIVKLCFTCLRDDYVGFRAETVFFVEKEQEAIFRVSSNDGFKLYLDNKLLLSRWENGYHSASIKVPLKPGLHKMTLYYYEWTGNAEISFSTTAQVLGLEEAVEKLWKELTKGKESLLDAYLSKLKEKITALEERVKSLETARQEILAKLQELKKLSELGIAKLQEKIEAIEQELKAKCEVLKKLQRLIQNLTSRISALQDEFLENIEQIKSAIQSLKEEEEIIEAEVENIERELLLIRGSFHDLKADLEVISSKLRKIEEALEPTSSWEVHWYEVVEPGVFGDEMGVTTFPLNFSFDWGYGRVYKKWDHVGFRAWAMIYISSDAYCYFSISANNGVSLYVDGKKIIDHWNKKGPGNYSIRYFLAAGWHKLELHYYEWEDKAWLSFSCR